MYVRVRSFVFAMYTAMGLFVTLFSSRKSSSVILSEMRSRPTVVSRSDRRVLALLLVRVDCAVM